MAEIGRHHACRCAQDPPSPCPPRASELVGLFEHLEKRTGRGRVPLSPAKRETMVRNIRAMIMRSRLSDQEVRTIRGMIVALVRNKYRGPKGQGKKS